MFVALYVALLAFTPVEVLQTEQTLAKGRAWSRDLILAPGDSLKVSVGSLRKVGSCCGPFGFLGDILLRKGDNVGRATISEWRGGVITSVYQQSKPELSYYSARGGAYTITIENHSGHRTNLYSIAATRVPTEKKYANFDPAFRSDTSYETTWTVETKKRLVREEIVRDTSWETVYDSTLVGIDTSAENIVDEVKHIPALSSAVVKFDIPADADRWAYWVGVEEAYSAMKQVFSGAAEATSLLSTNPVAALAAGIVSSLTANTKANVDVEYRLSQWQWQTSVWAPIVNGGRVKQSYRKMDSSGVFYFDLINSYSLLTPKNAHVQVSVIRFTNKYSVTSRDVPKVSTRKIPFYEDYNVNVPHVKLKEAPHLPWTTKR